MDTFKALRVDMHEGQIHQVICDMNLESVPDNMILIHVAYSSINYKDVLATTTTSIIRSFPMTPGIDASGVVTVSQHPNFKTGDHVVVTGYGLGVSHPGAFAEFICVPSEWVLHLPKAISLRDAMIVGTAGITAGLSVLAFEKNCKIDKEEMRILVTGATGGVATSVLNILKQLGYRKVDGISRKSEYKDYLFDLGVQNLYTPETFQTEDYKPLNRQRYDVIIDTVGGKVLESVLPYVAYNGVVTTCGNIAGDTLTTSIYPFILRGIQLIGIDSVQVSPELRKKLWHHFAHDWYYMDSVQVDETDLSNLVSSMEAFKKGTHIGRTIVVIDDELNTQT